MRLACRLREYRHALEMSLSDVSALTGISRGQLSLFERGLSLPSDSQADRMELAYRQPRGEWYALRSPLEPVILGDEPKVAA